MTCLKYMILTFHPPLGPDLWWACSQSEEGVQGWTPTGELHTLVKIWLGGQEMVHDMDESWYGWGFVIWFLFYLLRSVLLMLDWPNFTSLSGRTGNNLDQHLFHFKKSKIRLTKIIPASRAVTTAGARRFAPSRSILIRLGEFRRIEARHSDTTFETNKKNSIIASRGVIWLPYQVQLSFLPWWPCKTLTQIFSTDKIYLWGPGQIAGQNFLASLLGTKDATQGS